MKFHNVEEIQTLLDKTSTTADRLKTSLWLLSSQVSALKDLFEPLKRDCATRDAPDRKEH